MAQAGGLRGTVSIGATTSDKCLLLFFRRRVFRQRDKGVDGGVQNPQGKRRVVGPLTPVVVDQVPVPTSLDYSLVGKVIEGTIFLSGAVQNGDVVHPVRPGARAVGKLDRNGLPSVRLAEDQIGDVMCVCDRRLTIQIDAVADSGQNR